MLRELVPKILRCHHLLVSSVHRQVSKCQTFFRVHVCWDSALFSEIILLRSSGRHLSLILSMASKSQNPKYMETRIKKENALTLSKITL